MRSWLCRDGIDGLAGVQQKRKQETDILTGREIQGFSGAGIEAGLEWIL
jgi:hypothetical protein